MVNALGDYDETTPLRGLGRSKQSHATLDRVAIYCGPLAQLFFVIFLPASLNFPPISPSLTAEQTVDHYRRNELGMQIGISIMLLCGIAWPIFVAGINRQLSKIPGVSPTALWGQVAAGCLGTLSMMLPSMFFSVVIYRLDRDPVLTQTLSDLAWFVYAMGFPPFLAQDMMISYIVLSDKRDNPLIPRWVAWVTSGLTLGIYPALFVHFVKSGPLAWNGLLGFWFGAVAFGGQVGVLVYHLLNALEKPDPILAEY
ncbi:hypothetical protein S40285_10670 [Stachybotrys chlorohalonatus IBT 40285]|uniref:Integral membrane protein n=1 Tax=Stachybotrys chlorohalonatus (strain IBT 40285) TaxID=1283841 RepID=A0A084Q7U2_STAC4|nr:hypothetical protein S40285_10670 [Stachybotrys chlorohalonata IBT 40285]